MDTLGTKRDPINCEKAWLDFAVRLLSREAVGKGRGQETVWGARCKPSWWDRAVNHAWKNPTANPKDTKEILLEKYLALESHLRDEKRFPAELEEESRLWKEGKYLELFLMTSLTSLLGKVTSVHSAIEDACVKVNELNATVHKSILTNIQNCLKSSLKRTEQLNNVKNRATTNIKEVTKKARSKKRNFNYSGLHKENVECSPKKHKKLEDEQAPNLPIPSGCNQDFSDFLAYPEMHPTDILAFAQKLMEKRKIQSPNSSVTRNNNTSAFRPQREILPKTQLSVISATAPLNTALQDPNKKIALDNKAAKSFQQSSQTLQTPLNNSVNASLAPVCALTVTPEQLGYLLSQNTLHQMARADFNTPTASDLHVQSMQNNSFGQTCLSLEINKEPTADTNEKTDNFGTDPHLAMLEVPSDTLKSSESACSNKNSQSDISPNCEPCLENSITSDNICFDKVSKSEINPGSEYYPENSDSSSFFPPDDLDLSFLNNVDVVELCDELFKESHSSKAIDSIYLSGTDTSLIEKQNLFDIISENDAENQVETLLEDMATSSLTPFVSDLINFGDNPSTVNARVVSPSSSLDIGYCSEGSPSGSTGNNPMQLVKDQDPSFLLEKFLSYAENSFSADFQ